MDETAGLTTWACLATLIIGLGSISGCYLTEKTKWKAFEAGLVEKKEPINSVSVYTKP